MKKQDKSQRNSPSQARAQETVAVILQAAGEVLRSQGLQGFNTNRIAERAGVSIGTVYRYFPHKQSILVALARQLLQGDGQAVLNALEGSESASLPAVIESMVQALFARHIRDKEFRRIVVSTYLGAGQGGIDEQQVRTSIEALASHPKWPMKERLLSSAQLFVLSRAVLGVARALAECDGALVSNESELLAETVRLVYSYLDVIDGLPRGMALTMASNI